jgi:hypothetical protein
MQFAASTLAVMALLGGCNGSETTESRLTVDDLRTLVTVAPDATGWTWSAKPTTRLRSPLALAQADLARGIPRALHKEIARAGLERNGLSHWHEKGKQASSFASIYRTSEGARAVLAAERRLAQASNRNVGGHPVDVDVGDESWAVRGGSDTVGFVAIGWTRRNAVMGVHLECTTSCTSDVAAAAEAWAGAIDDAAQAASDHG